MDASRNETILLIEDNPVFLKVIKRRFETDGYRVIAADDGLIGLRLARKLDPDLIVLDLMLPYLDGHKVCRLLKFDRNLRKTPVVIFTSRDTDHDATLAKASHADAFLAKTVKPEVMLDVVRHLLDRAARFETEKIVFHDRESGAGVLR
jgi:DNA-binding response OmpR family regulator